MGTSIKKNRESRFNARWPAWLALLIVALLYEALPPPFYWGQHGLMISLVTLLIIPLIITHWRSHHTLHHILGLIVNIAITLFIVISVYHLVNVALEGQIGPKHLLSSSIILWSSNILLFALWYWSLDAGGPRRRESIQKGQITAFLFPQKQIAMMKDASWPKSIENWEPAFIDYLFLAFNASTAFSPTDTPILTRWAKCLSMIQALISLTIIVMLAARAINILNNNSQYFVS